MFCDELLAEIAARISISTRGKVKGLWLRNFGEARWDAVDQLGR